MEPKFITRSSFPVIGFELKTTLKDNQNTKQIPEFWGKIMAEKLIDKIPNRKDEKESLGVCTDFNMEDQSFIYMIASEVTSTDSIPDGMVMRIIPEAEYAVFTVKGEIPKSIQDAFAWIFNEWLPNSEYDHSDSADIELYDDRCCGGDASEMDIYIPVRKKAK
jgi:AraC family transcriptional regulator